MQKLENRNKEICRLKVEVGLSSQEIADQYNISRQRVFQILNELGHYRDEGALEKRKKQVYDYIVEYKMKHGGCSPSSHEIRNGCSLIGSWKQAKAHLNRLEKDGLLIQKKDNARTIEIVGGIWLPPYNPYNE